MGVLYHGHHDDHDHHGHEHFHHNHHHHHHQKRSLPGRQVPLDAQLPGKQLPITNCLIADLEMFIVIIIIIYIIYVGLTMLNHVKIITSCT